MDYRLTVLIGFSAAVAISSTLCAQPSRPVSLTPLPTQAATTPASGAELMERVARRIAEHQSVSAKIRHRSELFGPSLVGSGTYLQSWQDERLQVRFSLSVQMDDRLVSLLHVCDGRTLWMFDNLDGRAELSRVDLLRLREASAGEGRAVMPLLLGGGLPQLLSSLQTNFLVSTPQSVVFQDVPVWALALRWKPDRLSQLLGATDLFDDKGRLLVARLPEQLPDRVFLLVGQDDLFPYHIDYRRSESDDILSGMAASKKAASRSLTTMELFEVQFNSPLDPMWFVYKPGNTKIVDQTDRYLSQLKPIEPHDAVHPSP